MLKFKKYPQSKIKLKTESSFEKPETNSVTNENIKNRRNPVITFERPKLIYSLLAPPQLPTELPHLEVRDAPTRPELSTASMPDPFTFLLVINR